MESLPAKFYYSLWKSIDWIFPPSCVNCGKIGLPICPDCKSQIKLIAPPVCSKCGYPLKEPGLCGSCKKVDFQFDLLRSLAEYSGPIRKIILSNKFNKNISNGIELSKLLSPYIDKLVFILDYKIDLLIPIPLGEERMIERGYNQVGIFAFPLALKQHVRYSVRALKRIRETKPQVGLSAYDRRINVRNAFRANHELVLGKNILLVDDVATTGATLSSASLALREGGAKKVVALTCARVIYNR
ncbi:double zinc ribbon domain-containing protein [Chloroflexota bacterium]